MITCQITRDDQGVSVWPADAKLKFRDGEWYDEDCRTRGTNGLIDWDSTERMLGGPLEPGGIATIEVNVKKIRKEAS